MSPSDRSNPPPPPPSGRRMTSSARLTAIAPPGSLYTYLSGLYALADERPIDDDVVRALIGTTQIGQADLAEFAEGRESLIRLAPPIDATVIADANLDWRAARSLALAMVLRGKHVAAWARMKPNSPETATMLREVAEILNLLRLVMDGVPDSGGWALTRRLDAVEAELQAAGGKDAGRAVERKDEQRRRLSQPAAKAPTGSYRVPVEAVSTIVDVLPSGGGKLRLLLMLVIVSAGAGWLLFRTMTNDPPPPPAASYQELPVLALVRTEQEVTVRVRAEFLTRPEADQRAAIKKLYDRLAGERPAGLRHLILQDPRGKRLGAVTAGIVILDSKR